MACSILSAQPLFDLILFYCSIICKTNFVWSLTFQLLSLMLLSCWCSVGNMELIHLHWVWITPWVGAWSHVRDGTLNLTTGTKALISIFLANEVNILENFTQWLTNVSLILTISPVWCQVDGTWTIHKTFDRLTSNEQSRHHSFTIQGSWHPGKQLLTWLNLLIR